VPDAEEEDAVHGTTGAEAWQILRRGPVAFLGYTGLIGMGVATVGCCGLGFPIMLLGSLGILKHAAKMAGAVPGSKGSVWAGALAVTLATLLGGTATFGVIVVDGGFWGSVLTFTACAALMGAALSPLVLSPIAAAMGRRGPLSSVVRGTDLAGGARLGSFAPMCALIAVALLVPVPVVFMGLPALLGSKWGLALLGALAGVFWCVSVPLSAAWLTARYRQLESADQAPTRLRAALTPVLAAVGLGAFVFATSLAVSVVEPRETRVVAQTGALSGDVLGVSPPGDAAPYAHTQGIFSDVLVVGGRGRVRTIELGRPPFGGSPSLECASTRSADGGLTVLCDQGARRTLVRVAPDGDPVPVALVDRIRDTIGSTVSALLGFAVLMFAIALGWLGRLGVSLRLLSRSAFAWPGRVVLDDGGSPTFVTEDGAHRVRVAASRLSSAPGTRVVDGAQGMFLSSEALAPMDFRTAYAPCPPDALIVLGSRDEALARHVRRARKIGFRLGVLALAALVLASFAALSST